MTRARRMFPALAFVLLAASCTQLKTLSTEQALERLNVATTKLYAADGSLLANLHGEINRDIVPLSEVPKSMQNAVVAIEDQRFWTHGGVDVRSLTRAALANVTRAGTGSVQGGSTLSQQLVKQIYFAKPQRTLQRKIAEARVTFQFESQYPKPKIMEMYLNTIYLGRGAYGIQTAARSYFNKNASQLTLGEAAFLAGIIHEPGNYEWSPSDPAERRVPREKAALARRAVVLQKMRELGFITAGQQLRAASEPIPMRERSEPRWEHPYFVDMVLRQLGVLRSNRASGIDPRFSFLGDTYQERARNLYRGGLRVYTTLDPIAQSAAEEAVDKVLPPNLDRLSAALAAVEPQTGYIRALVGGREYYPSGCDTNPEAAAMSMACRMAKVNLALGDGGGGTGRQPGSSFKPFVLTAALERGVTLGARFDSSAFTHVYPGGVWKVGNYEGGAGGSMDLIEGTVNSVNAVYAHLEIDGVGDGNALRGSARVADVSRRLGIPFATIDELRARCGSEYAKTGRCTPADAVPAIALGAKEVAPLDMAGAYATLANEGVRVQPTAIAKITDAGGKVLFEAQPSRERAVARNVALGVSQVLQQVIQRGTAVRARISRPAAAKTGTAQEWRDAWLAGYVPQLAAVVWVGNPIGVVRDTRTLCPPGAPGSRCEPESMIPSQGYPFKIVGGTFPAMIWQYFMSKALADVPVVRFPAAPSELFGSQDLTVTPSPAALVPGVVGLSVEMARQRLIEAGLKVSETPCLARGLPESVVVAQDPGPGAPTPASRVVQICVARSDLPPVPTPRRPGGDAGTTGRVPNVVGESRASAQSQMQRAGYDTNFVRECDTGAAEPGRVWRQSPGGGSTAPPGSTVTMWYNPAGC